MTTEQKKLPPGVDFELQEAMEAPQLQHLLRQDFTGEILRNANVTVPRPLQPWMVLISGAFQAYGQTQYYETEIDIRVIETADHFLQLVDGFHRAFEAAAEQAKKVAA